MLRGINAGTIDLIATDPPFNKGKDFHATPDSLAAGASFQDRWRWDKDVDGEWIDKLQDDFPKVYHVVEGSRLSYGDDMGAFLCFMAVRLLEMHRILTDEGSIYLHCDQTASHYLKELMDAIFGKDNFRNEIVWERDIPGRGAKNKSGQFPRASDSILFYTKTDSYYFKQPTKGLTQEQISKYSHIEEGTGRRYTHYPLGTRSKEGIQKLEDNNRIYITKSGKKRVKYYLDEACNAIGNVWYDIISLGIATNSKERTGHPTQKPNDLYKRIIEASSKKGGMVLDPFCGCATTCVSAELLGRQWVGIDLWKKAHEVVWDRLKKECHLIDPEGESEDLTHLLEPEKIINYQTKPPICTDEQKEAVPFLPSKNVKYEPETPGERMSKAEMKQALLQQNGAICEGCHRQFDDERYLELDHKNPRSNGGANSLYNRILLCSPCNKMKSNKITLVELIRLNKKNRFWKGM